MHDKIHPSVKPVRFFGAKAGVRKNATERSHNKSKVPTLAVSAIDHRETYPCRFVIQSHS
jgi:hypothetical protein